MKRLVGLKAGAASFASMLLLAPAAQALNILITNDDGFEASTIHALYQTLKREGDDVIIASETQDNSGKGGAVDLFKPLQPLQRDTRGGFVKAGASGVGAMPGDDAVFYVDGTPVSAALFGIDIAALRRWHRAPDLVISGPNYGNNTGLLNNSSGTVNAALICINRGVPAIAVSTAVPKAYKAFDKLMPGDPEYEVAAIVARIVRVLDTSRIRADSRVLPQGMGLNVNVPAFAPGTARSLPIRLSRVGIAAAAIPVFVDDLSKDTAAQTLGIRDLPAAPGVSLLLPKMSVGERSVVVDRDSHSEQNVLNAGAVAISIIQGNHEADASRSKQIATKLGRLFTTH